MYVEGHGGEGIGGRSAIVKYFLLLRYDISCKGNREIGQSLRKLGIRIHYNAYVLF